MVSRQGDELFGRSEKPGVLNVGLRVLRMAGLGVSLVLLATTVHALTRSRDAAVVMVESPIGSGSITVDSSGFTVGGDTGTASDSWKLESSTQTIDPIIDGMEKLTSGAEEILQADGGFIWRLSSATLYRFPNSGSFAYLFCVRHGPVALCCSILPGWYLWRWSRFAWRNRGGMPAAASRAPSAVPEAHQPVGSDHDE